jgi:hypothetical protein
MEFEEKLASLASKVRQHSASLATEEATKTALIMPFIANVLGYDVFNPSEVVPEYTTDVGTKKGEKIDYAILKDGEIQILIECKKVGEQLTMNHASQLFRYFGVSKARVAILTNGRVYKFFTDLDAPNKMDEKPFLELDMLEIDEHITPELKKITKPAFDIDSIINAAGELKYLSQIKKVILAQFTKPEDDFVRFFASRVYDGAITQKVRDQFTVLTQKALSQFLNDQANERLKNAINGSPTPPGTGVPQVVSEVATEVAGEDSLIETTEIELEGFQVVRAIIRSEVDVKRVGHRDNQSYFGILLDDNNRKPICRLHFNRTQKYIGLFDEKKVETRHPIDTVDDIFKFSDALKLSVKSYL